MKISIITINKNNASGLEKTIQSVISQTFTDFEYIVIDGNSTDGSVDIIKRYSSGINYWISEPDTSIYNAMNKGILKARGEYCQFLNSGDWLISSTTLQDVFNEISNTIPADIFFSDCILSNKNILHYPDILSINYLLDYAINHQNTLIKHSLFMKHGLYNEKLNIVSDQEFFMKEMWIYKSRFSKIQTYISVYDLHGISSHCSPELFQEKIIMYQNVFQELSEIIIEIKKYHKSIYYKILKDNNETILLYFILKVYRFLFNRTHRLKCFLLKLCQK